MHYSNKRQQRSKKTRAAATRERGHKGAIYTLEALLVVGTVFFVLAYLFRFSPPTSQTDLPLIKRQGFEALEYMDQYYDLKKLVSDGNEAPIENTLETLLPASIKFETEICTNPCNAVGVSTKKSVVAVDYYVMTYRDQYVGKKLRLWLWR